MHLRLVSCLLAACLPLPLSLAQERPPAPVVARAVEARTVAARERVTGSVRATSESTLAALEEGPLVSFDVREGDVVRIGDVLARLDPRRLDAARAATAASRAEAEATRVQRAAEVEEAREELGAVEAAARTEALSARDLRRARTALAVAEAQAAAALARAEALDAELELLAVRLADLALRAPFDGVVVERHRELGEWIRAGDPVVTVLATGSAEVWLDVPERLYAALAPVPELTVSIGGTQATARVLAPRPVPRLDPRTRTFHLVGALLRDGDPAVPLPTPGMSVSAWLNVGRTEEALLVPKDALVHRPGGVGVMAVLGESAGSAASVKGTAALVPVVVRFELEREVAIEPGALEAGALVVTEGNERLFPGTAVLATVDRAPLESSVR